MAEVLKIMQESLHVTIFVRLHFAKGVPRGAEKALQGMLSHALERTKTR